MKLIYLNVPYAEKDHAKQRGARWDKEKKKWYVPDDANPQHFMRWMSCGPKNPKPLPKLSGFFGRKWNE